MALSHLTNRLQMEKKFLFCGYHGIHKKEISFPSVGGWSNAIEPLFEVKSNKFPSKSFVDFQHDVTTEDVRLAHREGFVSAETKPSLCASLTSSVVTSC